MSFKDQLVELDMDILRAQLGAMTGMNSYSYESPEDTKKRNQRELKRFYDERLTLIRRINNTE